MIRRTRRAAYRTGSVLGWVVALISGPGRVVARIANVLIGRKVVRRFWR